MKLEVKFYSTQTDPREVKITFVPLKCWDRCYDLLNICAKKFSKKWRF
jgi:hypothetical protein